MTDEEKELQKALVELVNKLSGEWIPVLIKAVEAIKQTLERMGEECKQQS